MFVWSWRLQVCMCSSLEVVVCVQVQAVREVVPGRSNNDIVLVLQYYDYSVEQTIQAFLESMYLNAIAIESEARESLNV